MKCAFEQMQTMCLSNCKPSVTNVPTMYINFDHLMKHRCIWVQDIAKGVPIIY